MKLPYNKHVKKVARDLRNNATLSEKILWRELKGKQFLGLTFNRQKNIGTFSADFYCDKLSFVIEIDGKSHIGREKKDENRDYYFAQLGIRTIRVSADDVERNVKNVLFNIEKQIVPLS